MAGPRHAVQAAQKRLILDSGAVIASSRNDHGLRSEIAAAIAEGVEVIVPAVVVAETARGDGARDALLNRLLGGADIPPTTERTAREAGRLLTLAGSAATIDALVVAEAAKDGGGVILTADVRDLRQLAAAHGHVEIQRI